jgi:hypothetical protein
VPAGRAPAPAELLGDQPFLLGGRPRTVDCTLYACLESVLGFPIDSLLRARVAARANLVDYRGGSASAGGRTSSAPRRTRRRSEPPAELHP